jgi:hypothetical protein
MTRLLNRRFRTVSRGQLCTHNADGRMHRDDLTLGPSKMRLRTTIIAFVGFVLAALPAFAASLEDEIFEDLKERSEGKPSQKYIGAFDLICFTLINSSAREELLQEGRRVGSNFSHSLDSCGVNRSCCNLWTQASGVIGVVKNDQIRCVEIHKFDYWLEKNAPRCLKPSNLRVQKQTSPPAEEIPGRPRFRPGRPAYRIGEEQ